MRPGLLDDYRRTLRDEPAARGYLIASVVDDVGIAVSGWASMLLLTTLFTSQRERAKLMIPSLACFLIGAVVSGPLADWAAGGPAATLARWRWKVVLVGRGIETALLGLLVVILALGTPTVGRVLPYVMVSAFMKTALRPTRGAFWVDLLRSESPQTDASGRPRLDEQGQPLLYKTHLLPFGSLNAALTSAAALAGLLLGGGIMGLVGGASWMLFLVDVLTNVGFIVIVARRCRPDPLEFAADDGAVDTVRELLPGGAPSAPAAPARTGRLLRGLSTFGHSVRDGIRFLAQPAQRPLLALLAGGWLVEMVSETYDGKMIVKHVLGGSDDAVRHGATVWHLVGLAAVVALPLATRWLGSLGKVFLATMLVDGLVIVAAGATAGAQASRAIVPFVTALCADHALTLVSGTLVDLSQNSASSTRMRGRIAAAYVFAVIVGDMVVEVVATVVTDAIGIPAMLVRVGVVQVAAVVVIGVLGGWKLWRFGLRTEATGARALPAPAGVVMAEPV